MNLPCPGADGRRDERIARLAATLDFALRATDHLLNRPAAGTFAEHPADAFHRRAKFVCESSLLVHLAAAVPFAPASLRSRIDALADAITPSARSEETSMTMQLRPTKAAELGLAHLSLTALGRPDPGFDAQYRRALATTGIGPPERVAWKDLEAGWHRDLGAPLAPLDLEAAARRTAYNQRQDVLSASRIQCYAVTHGLFYATGFGAHRPLLARDQGELLADIDSLTARCLDEDDFDLVAEVLMAWPLLRAEWSPTAIAALRVLEDVTDAYGILPSLSLRAEACEQLAPAEQAEHYFRESYHTVYVSGMLQAAILSADQDPLPRPSAVPHLDPVGRRLQELLPPREDEPWWPAVLLSSGTIDQGSLVRLLADVGARRAVLDKDLSRAHRIVTTFLETDLEPTPMIVQTGDLLARLSNAAVGAV